MNSTIRPFRILSLAGFTLATAMLASSPAAAQVLADGKPAAIDGLDIVEHRGEQLPLDLTFTDDDGRQVTLREFFKGDVPVILTMNYYTCPQLCTLTLNGLTDAMDKFDLRAGEKFRIVTVSINPDEDSQRELVKGKKQAYLSRYQNEASADGWHFLTGSQASIDALSKATGFPFRYVAGTHNPRQFAHPACIMFCTPTGTLSRYQDTIAPEPDDVRMALIEASQGKIGSAWDQFVLWCYHYDPKANSYSADAMKLMRLGGAATLLIMVVGLFVLWRKKPGKALHAEEVKAAGSHGVSGLAGTVRSS